MTYYTHHRYMGVLHYVSVDVSSDHSGSGMTYYTYHIHMGVLHYVGFDVPSDDLPA
jgi:hypothetical protein